jgi:hypothetical protein
MHFLAYKLPKKLFFTLKYLTRYTPETFLRNTLIQIFFFTYAIMELYLFKVLEVIYAPSRPD